MRKIWILSLNKINTILRSKWKKERTDGSCSLNAHLPKPNSIEMLLFSHFIHTEMVLVILSFVFYVCRSVCVLNFGFSSGITIKNQCANIQIKWILPLRTNDPNILWIDSNWSNCPLPIIRLGFWLPGKKMAHTLVRKPQINEKKMCQFWFTVAF